MQKDGDPNTALPALTFSGFKGGPGGRMCTRLGLDLTTIETWADLRRAAVNLNGDFKTWLTADDDHVFPYVARAEEIARVASSGELVLLCAILTATDFATQADKISEGSAWWQIDRKISGDYRLAVAACIAEID